MIKKYLAAAAVALYAVAGQVSASTITSLVGDIDGFGGQTAAGAEGVNTGSFFNNTTGSDPAFTDVWLLEQFGGAGGSPITYIHSYSLTGTAVSAELAIMESGMADERGPWDVLLNGNLLGSIGIDPASESATSELNLFAVDISWLTGNDTISLVYQDSQNEGFAIDYSQLTIQVSVVPVPAAGFLLLGALGALAGLRRRKKA